MRLIENSTITCEYWMLGAFDSPDYPAVDVVKFTYLHLTLYDIHSTSLNLIGRTPASVTGWAALWSTTIPALRAYFIYNKWQAPHAKECCYSSAPHTSLSSEELLDRDRKLAYKCLKLMAEIEARTTPADEVTEDSLFPSDLFAVLRYFTVDSKTWKVEELETIRRVAEEERVGVRRHGERVLPDGWEARLNRYGKIYYADFNTGTTTWDRPSLPQIVEIMAEKNGVGESWAPHIQEQDCVCGTER